MRMTFSIFLMLLLPLHAQSANQGLEFAVKHAVEERIKDAEVRVIETKTRGKLPENYQLELRSDPTSQSNLKLLIRDAKGSNVGWVDARVEVRVNAFLVTSNTERGEAILVTMVQRPIQELPRDRVHMEDLQDVVAVRSLRQDHVLTTRDIERPRVVERAQPLLLRVRRGDVVATQRALSLQPGKRGDLIRVRTANNQTVQAIVVDSNTCEVP